MIPQGTRFIGIAPSVNLKERKSATINAETQPYTLDDMLDDMRGYKVYIALLTQEDTDPPVAIVLENTLGFTPVWQRFEPGKYGFNFPSTPDYDKIWYVAGPTGAPVYLSVQTDLDFMVNTIVDNSLYRQPIEIRVYN